MAISITYCSEYNTFWTVKGGLKRVVFRPAVLPYDEIEIPVMFYVSERTF